MFEYALVAGTDGVRRRRISAARDDHARRCPTSPARTDFDCGIMISASHNPYYDNGIKLIERLAARRWTRRPSLLVEDYLDGKLEVFGQEVGGAAVCQTGADRPHGGLRGGAQPLYRLSDLAWASIPSRARRSGWTAPTAARWNIAKAVFDALGAETYVINDEPERPEHQPRTRVPPTSRACRSFVVEKGLDVGFAFDGDADRCLCVDEKGNVVTGDHILYIYGKLHEGARQS